MTQFGDYIAPKKKKVNRDAANEQTAYIRGNQPQPRQNENNPRDYDLVKTENGSGYAVDPLAVLRIHNATWPERTDQKFVNEGMRNGVESLGVKPSTEWDMVSVLQKSAPDSNFAQGVCSGPTPVFVLFRTQESLDYPFAIPTAEDSSKLVASPYGLNRILWHSEPSEDFQECTGEVLQAYVNMGEDGQWVFWKLKEDLPCCGSATGEVCDECGTVLQPDCPIERTIYAPKGLNLCGCETACGTWKAGDIVPAWWFQYLGKWVAIPNFHAGLEEKEVQVVTSLQLTGGTVTPATDYETVVTDLTIDTNKITLCATAPVEVQCLDGSISLTNATASGTVTVSGSIGDSEHPIQLDVVSSCDTVTIDNASISSTGNVSLTGSLSGSATVSVPLSNISLPVTGTCTGSATGTVTTTGSANLSGTCLINDNFPELIVTGTVIVSGTATLSGTITQTGNAVTLGGTSKTVLTGATYSPPTLTTSTVNLTIPSSTGTISGMLSNSSTTSVSLSGTTATLDLSAFLEEVDMVDPDTFSFSGCTLTWQTKKCLALKSGASLASLAAALSGSISIPSAVTGTSNHATSPTSVTIKGVDQWNSGGLTLSSESVTIPTTATLDETKLSISGTGTMSTTGTVTGIAVFPQDAELRGTCSVSGNVTTTGSANLSVSGTISGTASGSSGTTATGTATITDTVTVSGPLSVSSGVTIRGSLSRDCPQYARGVLEGVTLSSSGSVSLPVTGTITDSRECYVDVPTELCYENGWLNVEQARVPFPSVDLTGATISGTTATLKYVACADCPESEEEEEEPSA